MLGMDFEDKSSKKYCMKKTHVAIICGVVAVALIVGLAVGLTRPTCPSSGGNEQLTSTTVSPTPTDPAPIVKDPCPAENDESGEWKNFMLPSYINPVHYDLDLQPEMEEDRYNGTVTISISVEKNTRHLWLHLRETKITEMPLLKSSSSGQSIVLKRCFEYKQQEYVVIEAEEELTPTSYLLTMTFQGHLNGSLVGFYRTTYVENGQTK